MHRPGSHTRSISCHKAHLSSNSFRILLNLEFVLSANFSVHIPSRVGNHTCAHDTNNPLFGTRRTFTNPTRLPACALVLYSCTSFPISFYFVEIFLRNWFNQLGPACLLRLIRDEINFEIIPKNSTSNILSFILIEFKLLAAPSITAAGVCSMLRTVYCNRATKSRQRQLSTTGTNGAVNKWCREFRVRETNASDLFCSCIRYGNCT